MKKTWNRHQALSGSNQLSFLPQLDFNPKVPGKNTILYHALMLLLRGKEINHRDFDKETSSYRLAAYVLDLKKTGWLILDFPIIKLFSKQPKIRRHKCYYIPEHFIKKLKKN